MADMSPITNDEAERFAAKFTGWTEELTDRERMVLGTAIAASRDKPIGAAPATALIPVVAPVIAAILSAIAATIVMIEQIEAKALENQAAAKEREASLKDLSQQLGRQSAERGIQSARRGRDLGLPDDN